MSSMQTNIKSGPGSKRASASYTLGPKWEPDIGPSGSTVYIVTGTCALCGATEEIRWLRGDQPELVARAFQQRGWRFDKYLARKCACPACIAKERDMAARPAIHIDPKIRDQVVAQRTAEAEIEMALADGEPIATLVAVRTPPKPLTTEQRAAVRRELDHHFDDSVGAYIDGRSDKVIGEQLGIPWKHVEMLRELAYGPLRGDPKLDALTTRVAELQAQEKRLSGTLASATEALATMRKDLEAAMRALTELRKRFA